MLERLSEYTFLCITLLFFDGDFLTNYHTISIKLLNADDIHPSKTGIRPLRVGGHAPFSPPFSSSCSPEVDEIIIEPTLPE